MPRNCESTFFFANIRVSGATCRPRRESPLFAVKKFLRRELLAFLRKNIRHLETSGLAKLNRQEFSPMESINVCSIFL